MACEYDPLNETLLHLPMSAKTYSQLAISHQHASTCGIDRHTI
jgi:hypothetical protein